MSSLDDLEVGPINERCRHCKTSQPWAAWDVLLDCCGKCSAKADEELKAAPVDRDGE